MVINNGADSQLFLLEVTLASQSPGKTLTGLSPRRGQWFLKVPVTRLSQEIRQLTRLGVKILRITPISLLLATVNLDWWLEVYTDNPRCLYYFGPFNSKAEAQYHQSGYVEDLQQEGADHISVQIKQCHPQTLTQEW